MIENVKRDHIGERDLESRAPLPQPFALDCAQELQAARFDGTDAARTLARGAGLGAHLEETWTETLTRKLEQTKRADPAQLNPRAIDLYRFLEPLLDFAIVAGVVHVDKIDHDEPGQITQAQLARDLIGSLEVRLGRRLLDVPFLGGPARVHVDRNQGFRRVEHDVAARLQRNLSAVHRVQLILDLIAMQERNSIVVRADSACVAGDHRPYEVLRRAVSLLTLNQDLLDIPGVEIADRALDQVRLFVDQGGRRGFQRDLPDLVPQANEVIEVPFDFGPAAGHSGGTHDHAHG